MQPSALEARGYTLPTTIPCTSKYPESSVQMKACTAQHPAASPALCSTRPGWQGGFTPPEVPKSPCPRHQPAPCLPLPASTGLSAVPGLLNQEKVMSPHAPPAQRTNPASGLRISSEWAWQKAASVLWPPQSWQPRPGRHAASKGTVQAVLCWLQLCWPAFAGSSGVAAPSCVNLFPPPSCLELTDR